MLNPPPPSLDLSTCLVPPQGAQLQTRRRGLVAEGRGDGFGETGYEVGGNHDGIVAVLGSQSKRTQLPALAQRGDSHPYVLTLRMLRCGGDNLGFGVAVGQGRFGARRKHETFEYERRTGDSVGPHDRGERFVQRAAWIERLLLDRRPASRLRIKAHGFCEFGFTYDELVGGCEGKQPGWLVPTGFGDVAFDFAKHRFKGGCHEAGVCPVASRQATPATAVRSARPSRRKVPR